MYAAMESGSRTRTSNRPTSVLAHRSSSRFRSRASKRSVAAAVAVLAAGTIASALSFSGSIGALSRIKAQPKLQTSPTSQIWLDTLNAYRSNVGLPAVAYDSLLQNGVDLHAKYLAVTGAIAHSEDPANPLFTESGAKAASQSLVGGWAGRDRTDREVIEDWIIAPFHATHIFEPRLQRAALGVNRNEPGAALNVAAVLNIIGGIGPKTKVSEPIVFPGRGTSIPLTIFRTETPDPLTHCPGFTAPAGLPLMAMFPTMPDNVTASLATGGAPVETCTIDANYNNPDPERQNVGRTLLAQKHMVIVIPRAPLVAGTEYEATVTGGQAGTVKWKFSIANSDALPTASLKSETGPANAQSQAANPVTSKPKTNKSKPKLASKIRKPGASKH
jgi:uncharacterized protein YkwD